MSKYSEECHGILKKGFLLCPFMCSSLFYRGVKGPLLGFFGVYSLEWERKQPLPLLFRLPIEREEKMAIDRENFDQALTLRFSKKYITSHILSCFILCEVSCCRTLPTLSAFTSILHGQENQAHILSPFLPCSTHFILLEGQMFPFSCGVSSREFVLVTHCGGDGSTSTLSGSCLRLPHGRSNMGMVALESGGLAG